MNIIKHERIDGVYLSILFFVIIAMTAGTYLAYNAKSINT